MPKLGLSFWALWSKFHFSREDILFVLDGWVVWGVGGGVRQSTPPPPPVDKHIPGRVPCVPCPHSPRVHEMGLGSLAVGRSAVVPSAALESNSVTRCC